MALTHRKADTSKNKASKSNTSKNRKNKTEYIKGTLDDKKFENLAGSVTVQLAKDTNPKSKRIAWGGLTIAGCFVIYISVYEGENGYFVRYPNYKDNEDNYHDLVYCFDRDVIEGLTDLITKMIDGDEEEEECEDLPF